jgi:nucleotide-binding universal stress UspA family protein
VYKHILIPTDGSALSDRAVDHGVKLAKALGAKVTALTVTAPFHVSAFETGFVNAYKEYIAVQAAKCLRAAKETATAAGVACDVVQIEDEQPHQAIINAAKRLDCDVIVMASHGRRGVSAIVLGSETIKVLNHSTIPVVVVRAEPTLQAAEHLPADQVRA